MKLRHLIALVCLGAAACGEPASNSGFSHLQVDDHTVATTNAVPLTLSGPDIYTMAGPNHFMKTTDTGLLFEVSLANFVTPDAVVSLPAERLADRSGVLDYTHLPQADWPSDKYNVLASTCMEFTREQAEQLPETTGVAWILEAGFDPTGHFAVWNAIRASDDGNDEASVEIIARVESCQDPAAVEAALEQVRSQFDVHSN